MENPIGKLPAKTFNFADYQTTTDDNKAVENLINQTATLMTDEPRLNKRQKTQIREGLEQAGANSVQHPLNSLFSALKLELSPESNDREKSLNDFATRYTGIGDTAGTEFLQLIQNPASELNINGLAKSIEETAEQGEDRSIAIALYVSENYKVPL